MHKIDYGQQSLFVFFWQIIRQKRWACLILQLCSLAWAIDSTVWPYAFKSLLDKLLAYQHDSNVWSYLAPVLFFWAALWIFVEVLWRIQGFLMAKLMPFYTRQLRDTMFNYILGHSFDFYSNRFAGSLANKISDMVHGFTRIIELNIIIIIPASCALVLGCYIFSHIAWPFPIILLSWSTIHFAICIIGGIRCAELSQNHTNKRSELSGKIVDIFSNIINVKLFGRHFEKHVLHKARTEEQQHHHQALYYTHLLRILLGISCFLGMGVVMTWCMIYFWHQGLISISEIALLFTASSNITIMIWVSSLELPNLFREIGACQQAYALLKIPHQIKDDEDAQQLEVTQGKIEFKHIDFSYNNQVSVFKDLSITIPAHCKIGLVGYSGSGKTSLINLLLRFYEPQSGEILIDGQPINHVSQQSLRQAITMIPQEATLFHRSLYDNISYSHPQAREQDVYQAAELAGCLDFISKLPHGFQTLVGERGIKLSGGQRQRIAIARAVLKASPILVLDEATSALDSVTEQTIQQSLEKLMCDRTTLVIAHRLSTLAYMDTILVFHQGQLIESGNHQQLLEHQGHYARMWKRQAGGFLPEH